MARTNKVSPGHLEEKPAAHNRARKPEVSGGTPVHQTVQRLTGNAPGTADPESIKELQRTVGNRLVGQLISPQVGATAPPVQREPVTAVSEDRELVTGVPDTTRVPGAPAPAPIPYPNTTAPSGAPKSTGQVKFKNKATAVESSKLGSSKGDEPGTMKGLSSMANASIKPGGSKILTPMQSPITLGAGQPSETTVQSPGSTEQEGAQPAPTQSPPAEEAEEA